MARQSAHFDLRDAFVALLRGSPAAAGVEIVAGQRRAMPDSMGRRISVELIDSPAGKPTFGAHDWDTRFFVVCQARSDTKAAGDARADALLVDVVDVLLAPGLELAGSAVDVSVSGLQWDWDEADTQIANARAALLVRHRTTATSIVEPM